MATKSNAGAASTPDSLEKSALQALEKIERAVLKHEAGKSRAATAAATDIASACKVYKQIQPWLTTALPLIEKIPVYGKKIAVAIRTLMQIADIACAV